MVLGGVAVRYGAWPARWWVALLGSLLPGLGGLPPYSNHENHNKHHLVGTHTSTTG